VRVNFIDLSKIAVFKRIVEGAANTKDTALTRSDIKTDYMNFLYLSNCDKITSTDRNGCAMLSLWLAIMTRG
jgi:hypothetical protein